MTYEADPLKQLTCYVSFDPALDRDAMGEEFDKHFGRVGDHYTHRYGTRDPGLIKVLPGKRASTFVLRPLRAVERIACDSLPTAEGRWLRALSYALVRAECCPPLSYTQDTVFPKQRDTVPALDEDALDYLAERVSIEALYEIGAVAYSRSRLGPFAVGFAPLPVTSALALVRHLQSLVDIHVPRTSDTSIIKEELQSLVADQKTFAVPGPAPVIKTENSPSDPVETH